MILVNVFRSCLITLLLSLILLTNIHNLGVTLLRLSILGIQTFAENKDSKLLNSFAIFWSNYHAMRTPKMHTETKYIYNHIYNCRWVCCYASKKLPNIIQTQTNEKQKQKIFKTKLKFAPCGVTHYTGVFLWALHRIYTDLICLA